MSLQPSLMKHSSLLGPIVIRHRFTKLLFLHYLQMFYSVFAPGRPFQPSVMFAGKARSLLYGRGGSCLSRKHYIRLEKLAKDKHSSLFYPFVSYGEKRICEYGPWRSFFLPLPFWEKNTISCCLVSSSENRENTSRPCCKSFICPFHNRLERFALNSVAPKAHKASPLVYSPILLANVGQGWNFVTVK